MLLMALGSGAVEKGRQAFRGPVRPWGKLRVHEEPHFALGTRSYFREPFLTSCGYSCCRRRSLYLSSATVRSAPSRMLCNRFLGRVNALAVRLYARLE